MVVGKTIQIFLPDGNPRSVKIAEITNRIIQAIYIPRAKLDFALKRNEVKNVGVYFLIGPSDDEIRPKIYIGEAEDCSSRLKQHNKEKDFWNIAIVIISKTKSFTKTHVKFLESICFKEALKANRFKLVNSSVPNEPFVSEPMKVDLLDSFETIKILVATLGYPIFDEIKRPQRKNILYCKGKNASAKGEYLEDGFVVFKGSICNLTETKSAGDYVINMRKRLIDDGVLVKRGDVYEFQTDYIFSSPSAAAAVVLARRANGWTEWKYENGKTLDEVIRQNK